MSRSVGNDSPPSLLALCLAWDDNDNNNNNHNDNNDNINNVNNDNSNNHDDNSNISMHSGLTLSQQL